MREINRGLHNFCGLPLVVDYTSNLLKTTGLFAEKKKLIRINKTKINDVQLVEWSLKFFIHYAQLGSIYLSLALQCVMRPFLNWNPCLIWLQLKINVKAPGKSLEKCIPFLFATLVSIKCNYCERQLLGIVAKSFASNIKQI